MKSYSWVGGGGGGVVGRMSWDIPFSSLFCAPAIKLGSRDLANRDVDFYRSDIYSSVPEVAMPPIGLHTSTHPVVCSAPASPYHLVLCSWSYFATTSTGGESDTSVSQPVPQDFMGEQPSTQSPQLLVLGRVDGLYLSLLL